MTFIYPILEGKSRTVRVRLEFDNTDQVLKPGMFANVVLLADSQPDAVVVPSEAIVRSGYREQVFVVREPGKFEPREVQLGFSAAGQTQVLAGIQPGEEVVVSGQFLIDSESKLREATAKMLEAMAGDSHDHSDMSNMDMSDMSMDSIDATAISNNMDMSDMDMSDMTMESLPAPPAGQEQQNN